MLKINIITQLLIFFIMAISINFLNLTVLNCLFVFILVLLVMTKNNRFLRALLRFKWFFIVMFLIFSFNTPGRHVLAWPIAFSPTHEGITTGGVQVLRVMLMLAALSLILACNTRQQLISGLYFIFSPVKLLGLKVERFAARLWLTLHYVDMQSITKPSKDFISQLKQMATLQSDQVNADISVTLLVPKFKLMDFVTLAILLLSGLIYMFKQFA